jgi:Type II secretory pathway, component PulD
VFPFLLIILTALPVSAQSAKQLFAYGRKAEKQGDAARAFLLYSQAVAKDPGNEKYRAFSNAIRPKALPHLRVPALEEALEDGAPAPVERIPREEIEQARQPQPPRELKGAPELKSFDLRATARQLFEEVLRAYGLDAVFDGDYPAAGPLIRFRMENVNYREALHALEASTSSFLVPIGDRLALVVKDTPQKRQEVEPTAAVLIPIPGPVTIQEAQELARSVQQLMEIQRLVVDSDQRLILVRDRLSKVYPAQLLMEQLLGYSGQVSVEVEFLAVNRSSALDYGLRLQTLFPIVNFGNEVKSIPAGFTRFATFGGGRTLFGVGLASSDLFGLMTQSSADTIIRSEVRTLEGKAATLHVGDKYPIVTAAYSGADPGDLRGLPPPTISFEDLGVVLKLTPFLHGDREVTLEVEAEYKVLTGAMLNGIPVISTRKFNSRMRLKEGELAVMAGLLSVSSAKSYSGMAGLSTLPAIGPVFRSNISRKDYSHVLVVLKPRILGLPPSELATHSIYVGSEARPLSQL